MLSRFRTFVQLIEDDRPYIGIDGYLSYQVIFINTGKCLLSTIDSLNHYKNKFPKEPTKENMKKRKVSVRPVTPTPETIDIKNYTQVAFFG